MQFYPRLFDLTRTSDPNRSLPQDPAWNAYAPILMRPSVISVRGSSSAECMRPPGLAQNRPRLAALLVPERLQSRHAMAVLGVHPTFKVGLAFFRESLAGLHQICFIAVLTEGGGQTTQIGSNLRAHLPHHVHRVDARCRGEGQQVLSHLERTGQELLRLDQAIEEPDLVESLRGKAD